MCLDYASIWLEKRNNTSAATSLAPTTQYKTFQGILLGYHSASWEGIPCLKQENCCSMTNRDSTWELYHHQKVSSWQRCNGVLGRALQLGWWSRIPPAAQQTGSADSWPFHTTTDVLVRQGACTQLSRGSIWYLSCQVNIMLFLCLMSSLSITSENLNSVLVNYRFSFFLIKCSVVWVIL